MPFIRYSLWLEHCYQDKTQVWYIRSPAQFSSWSYHKLSLKVPEAIFTPISLVCLLSLLEDSCMFIQLSVRGHLGRDCQKEHRAMTFIQELRTLREGKKHCEVILCFCIWNRVLNRLVLLSFTSAVTFCNIVIHLTIPPTEMGEVKAKIFGILECFALVVDTDCPEEWNITGGAYYERWREWRTSGRFCCGM